MHCAPDPPRCVRKVEGGFQETELGGVRKRMGQEGAQRGEWVVLFSEKWKQVPPALDCSRGESEGAVLWRGGHIVEGLRHPK